MKSLSLSLSITALYLSLSSFLPMLLLLAPYAAEAKKLLIVTDQPSGAKALEIQQLFRTTSPFKLLKSSEFTIEVKVLDRTSKPIKCYPTVVKYNDKEIASMKYWSEKNGMPLTKDQIQKYKKGFVIERLTTCDKQGIAAIGTHYQSRPNHFRPRLTNDGWFGRRYSDHSLGLRLWDRHA